MTAWTAGVIGGLAGLIGGFGGFEACRRFLPRRGRGTFIDGGAFAGVLIGYPAGAVAGLVSGLLAARGFGGPYAVWPALGLSFILPLAPVALVFLGRRPRS